VENNIPAVAIQSVVRQTVGSQPGIPVWQVVIVRYRSRHLINGMVAFDVINLEKG
jgi:hypothetical protein